MKTTLINQQKKLPIALKKLQHLTNWIAEQMALKTVPKAWDEISIILTDDEGITHTNREYFNKNWPTDVISFRYDPIPGEDNLLSGDLIINTERAMQEGPHHDGVPYELALYIAHGFNHLTGAEDNTPIRKKAMRATETQWLTQATALKLLDNLLPSSHS